jgi:hypothetical protein
MEEAEKGVSQAAQLLERRGMPRCAVDTVASLALVSLGKTISGRMVDLSAGGCRMVLAEMLPKGMHAAVEVSFRIHGIGFRLNGLTEWTSGGDTVGISFGLMSSRRRDDLLEVLCEVEAAHEARVLSRANGAGAAAEPENGEPRRSVGAGGQPEMDPGSPGVEAKVTAPAPFAVESEPADEGAKIDPRIWARTPIWRDRRVEVRCGVDTSAAIHLVKIRSRLQGQICDLSLGGCRIHTVERFPVGIYTRVEIEFRLQGMPLLLGGVVQAIHGRNEVGIRFLDVSLRKREQLAGLIAEIREMQSPADAG